MFQQGSLTGHLSSCRPFYICRNGKLCLTPPFSQAHRNAIVRAEAGGEIKLLEKPELKRPPRPPPPSESASDQPTARAEVQPSGTQSGPANGSTGKADSGGSSDRKDSIHTARNGKVSTESAGNGKLPRRDKNRRQLQQRLNTSAKAEEGHRGSTSQAQDAPAGSRTGGMDQSTARRSNGADIVSSNGSKQRPQAQHQQRRQGQPYPRKASSGTAQAPVAASGGAGKPDNVQGSVQARTAGSAPANLRGPPQRVEMTRPQRTAAVQAPAASATAEVPASESEVEVPTDRAAEESQHESESRTFTEAELQRESKAADPLVEDNAARPAASVAPEVFAEAVSAAGDDKGDPADQPVVGLKPESSSAPGLRSEEGSVQASAALHSSLNRPPRVELRKPQLRTPPATGPASPLTNAAASATVEAQHRMTAPPQDEAEGLSEPEAIKPVAEDQAVKAAPEASALVPEPSVRAKTPQLDATEEIQEVLTGSAGPSSRGNPADMDIGSSTAGKENGVSATAVKPEPMNFVDGASGTAPPLLSSPLRRSTSSKQPESQAAAASSPPDDVRAKAAAEAASSAQIRSDDTAAEVAQSANTATQTSFVDGAVGDAPALMNAPRRPAPPPQRAARPAPATSGDRRRGTSSGAPGFQDQGRRQPSFVRGNEERMQKGAYNSNRGRQVHEQPQSLRSVDETEEQEAAGPSSQLSARPQSEQEPEPVAQARAPELAARPVLGERPRQPPTQEMINRASAALLRERTGYQPDTRPRQNDNRLRQNDSRPRQDDRPQDRPQPQMQRPSQPSPADAEVNQGAARDSRPRRKERMKQDVEQHRESRYERKQRRIEQRKADAREQEEIFEVGGEGMMVGELSDRLAINPGDVVKALFMKGIMANVNQVLDREMVKIVADEYGVEVLDIEDEGVDNMARKTVDFLDDDDIDFLVPRPPVVTVMGHVDHGKTSLLDYIRKTKVAAGEAGGITQAIGAYTGEVTTSDGEVKKITFLDTPGHEAFSAMRARGAKVTDVAIIVVACDDGVRPQTLEAISHAKAAKVPIVVAINKIDKEGANIERAKQEMSEAGLLPEEWGGDTAMVPISAKKGMGVDDLLETVLLVAEVEQLTANPQKAARGTVVEAHLDKRTGPVATLLVATGTLKQGDVVHAGATYGRVRTMSDSRMLQVEKAGPSIAVQMVGLNNVPTAGDEFTVCASEPEARKFANAIEESIRLERLAEQAGGTMVTSHTFATMDEDGDGLQYLNVILKADASGACEAIKGALNSLPQDRVSVRFLLAAAAEITTSDVQLAYASEGRIIGFNLEISEAVQAAAKQFGVTIKSYKVIYELVDDMRALMEGRLGVVEERIPLGEATVRAVFGSGSRRVAGCMVTEGSLRKGALAVVTRGKKQVAEGTLNSLRRVKEVVTEVSNGLECGVGVEGFDEWREGDKIEAFEVKVKNQSLEEASESRVANSLAFFDDGEDEDSEG